MNKLRFFVKIAILIILFALANFLLRFLISVFFAWPGTILLESASNNQFISSLVWSLVSSIRGENSLVLSTLNYLEKVFIISIVDFVSLFICFFIAKAFRYFLLKIFLNESSIKRFDDFSNRYINRSVFFLTGITIFSASGLIIHIAGLNTVNLLGICSTRIQSFLKALFISIMLNSPLLAMFWMGFSFENMATFTIAILFIIFCLTIMGFYQIKHSNY